MSDKFKFRGIDKLKRRPDIEGETGTELGVGAGITLITLAATDNNPRWRAGREDMLNELNRMRNANAPAEKIRAFLAAEYSRRLLIGWYYTDPESGKVMPNAIPDEAGNPIPFNVEAGRQFLIEADDALTMLEAVVYESKHFRGARIEAVVEQAKN